MTCPWVAGPVSSRPVTGPTHVDAVVVWGRVVLIGPTGSEVALWVLSGSAPPDLGVVEALARWQLFARRAGGSIRLCQAAMELAELLDLVGLRREVGGQPERGEQVLAVEEGVEPGDPVA